MKHASSVIDRSMARKYFGKDAQYIGRSDFGKLLRRWKGPQRLLRSGEGRKALLFLLGHPRMVETLTRAHFLQLVPAIAHAAPTVLENGGPQDLYQLAVIANVVGHELEERAGLFSKEARAVTQTKGRLLRHLAHTYPEDVACTGDPYRPGLVVVRLRHSARTGLHMAARDLPPNMPVTQHPAYRQTA